MTLLVGCREDFMPNPVPDPGTEVCFSANLTDADKRTRTYYAGEIKEGEGDDIVTKWTIKWNDASSPYGYDQIYVYAPDAMAGRNQARFQVIPASSDNTETGDGTATGTTSNDGSVGSVIRIGDTGIQWGESATKFYGFYPGKESFNPTIDADGNIELTMPGEQIARVPSDMATEVEAHKTTDSHNYQISGDMSCCLMAAATDAISPSDNPIKLSFKPLSTVLDITIRGPQTNNTTNPVNVTSVRISSKESQITGKFSYNFDTGIVTCKASTEDIDKDRSIMISTLYQSADGVYRGIPLYNTQTLNLQAFLIPNTNIQTLTVSVYTADGSVWNKDLVVNQADHALAQRKINQVMLPQLRTEEAMLDFSSWISQLDPRIYISDLSIPGSCLSFNYSNAVGSAASGSGSMVQSGVANDGDLDAQFNSGIRVFQAHCWYDSTTKTDFPGLDCQAINIVDTGGNPIMFKGSKMTLYALLTRLQELMEQYHGDEFCVLMLSDYAPTNEATAAGYQEFHKSIGQISDYLANTKKILPADKVTDKTTIEDVKDKVILKMNLNAALLAATIEGIQAGVTGATVQNFNISVQKLQSWNLLDKGNALFTAYTRAALERCQYAPMYYGDDSNTIFGTFDYTPATTENYFESWAYHARWKVAPNPTPNGVQGFAYQVAKKFTDTAEPHYRLAGDIVTAGFNYEDEPNDLDSSQLYYIYSEQANPGASSDNYDYAFDAITELAGIIDNKYKTGFTNKYFMMYLGGAGGSDKTVAEVTTGLNNEWLGENCLGLLRIKEGVTYTKVNYPDSDGYYEYMSSTENGNYVNFGWVLVNNVSLSYVQNPRLTTDKACWSSANVIRAVIGNNGQQNLLLQRDFNKQLGTETTTVNKASQAIANKVTNGGSLFKSRRR